MVVVPNINMFLNMVVFFGITSGEILFESEKTNSVINACVLEIIEKYADRKTVVFLSDEEKSNNLCKSESPCINSAFSVMHLKNAEKLLKFHRLFIVLFPREGSNYSSLFPYVSKLTYFVLVGDKNPIAPKIIGLFTDLHNLKMIYSVLLIPVDDQRVKVFTTFPHSASHCKGSGPPVEINRFYRGKFIENMDLFHTRKYWNMYGCPVQIAAVRLALDAFISAGERETNVFNAISTALATTFGQVLNFTPRIILPQLSNSRGGALYYTGIHRILSHLHNDTDVVIGTISHISLSDERLVSFGQEILFQCFTWAIPRCSASERSIFTNYFREFPFSFWVLFTISFVATIFIINVLMTILHDNRQFRSIGSVFWYTFMTVLQKPSTLNIDSWSLKLYIVFWLFYLLVISTAYLAAMWSFKVAPFKPPSILSSEDLLASSISFGGSQPMLDLLKEKASWSKDRSLHKMIRRYRVIKPSDFNTTEDNIGVNCQYAVLGAIDNLKKQSMDLNGIFNPENVYITDGCLFQSPLSPLLFSRNSPLRSPMNAVLNRLFETSLLSTIVRSMANETTSNATYNAYIKTNSKKMVEKTNLRQLNGLFFILAIGYTLSTAVFVVEIIANKCKNH